MSKESEKIIDAFQKGSDDKRLKKPYQNPYNKNSQKSKYKSYRKGYNE